MGDALLPRLLSRGEPVLAVTRSDRPALAGVRWLHGSFESLASVPEGVARIISLGPLEQFSDWFCRVQPEAVRVVALGSTGRVHKRHSPDPAERAVARALDDAGQALLSAGERLHCQVTVLEPTLLYGNGRDRSLSRLAAFARRWRMLPMPARASGLRQPVHVEDVAGAVMNCLPVSATFGRRFELPGGEVLPFDAMVARTLARHAPGARVLRLPTPLFEFAMRVAIRASGSHPSPGMLARVQADQMADSSAAHEAFGYQPRAFDP